MRPSYRQPVDKKRSAGQFRHNTRKTKAANMNGPTRGGIRL